MLAGLSAEAQRTGAGSVTRAYLCTCSVAAHNSTRNTLKTTATTHR